MNAAQRANNMSHQWSTILMALLFVFFFGLACQSESSALPSATAPNSPDSGGVGDDTGNSTLASQFEEITYDEESLVVKKGEYAELELTYEGASQQPVQWSINEEQLPVGMYLENTDSSKVLLFGTPEFTGAWCFTLVAETSEENYASSYVCLNSEDNENMKYPLFKKDRFLPEAIVDQFYQVEIPVETEPYKGTVYWSNLPEDISVKSHYYKFVVNGRFLESQTYSFVLKVLDPDGGVNYRQFQLSAVENDDEFSCPIGYYFDKDLGYCVQDDLDKCPDGTFYDPDVNNCVQYPQPPPEVRCATDHYYDHFLNECVRYATPRCPYNYRYSDYYGRCVRNAYTCRLNERYSPILKECVPRYRELCNWDEYWDSYYRMCLPVSRSCAPGYHWDRHAFRCERNRRLCGAGEHWDPSRGRCVPRRIACAPGYDWNGFDCVRRVRPRRCGVGEHWSPRDGRCVRDVRPPRREPPRMRPPRPPRMQPNPPPRMQPTPPPRMQPSPPPRMQPTPPPRMQPSPPPRMQPEPPRMQPSPPPRMQPEPPRMQPSPPPRMQPDRPPRMQPPPGRQPSPPPRMRSAVEEVSE